MHLMLLLICDRESSRTWLALTNTVPFCPAMVIRVIHGVQKCLLTRIQNGAVSTLLQAWSVWQISIRTSWALTFQVVSGSGEELSSLKVTSNPDLRLLSVWSFACSPHVSVGFCQVLRFPPMFKNITKSEFGISKLPQGARVSVMTCNRLESSPAFVHNSHQPQQI